MKKLKILMITEDFLPIYGGITSVVEKLSKGLSKFGFADVTIATIEYDKLKHPEYKEDQTFYKIIRCKGKYNKITTNMSASLLSDKDFRKQLESEKYDVIHCHFPARMYKYGLKIGKLTKTPVVISCHGIFYPDAKFTVKNNMLAKLVTKVIVKRLNKADSIWAVTNFCKNYLQPFGLRKDTRVVYNAVDTAQDVTKCDYDFRKTFNISEDTFLITSVGRLVKMKNNEFNINALASLKDKNIKYAIIGSGLEENYLRNLAKELGVENMCIFAGAERNRAKLSKIYETSNLICFPSVGDSAGLIQVEAAYFNKPTLALENTAISELLIDGENGFVSKPDIQSYAEKLLEIYNKKDSLQEIGQKAHDTIYRSYSSKETIEEIYNVYLDVIKNYEQKHLK